MASWAIAVEIDGEEAVRLESRGFDGGRELSETDVECIREAIRCLSGFIGIDDRTCTWQGAPPLRGYKDVVPTRWRELLGGLADVEDDDPIEIQLGDVIRVEHGHDAPFFQALMHPAAVEDWNGKLRSRVAAIYRRIWAK